MRRPSTPRARRSPGEPAWLVGGAVRDRLLGRPTADLDVVVDGRRRRPPRSALGRAPRGGPAFELSDEFGAWRVVGAGPALAGRPRAAARRHARGRPRAARLHDQRDRRAARRRRARRPARRARRPRRAACCGWSVRSAFADDPLRVAARWRGCAVELGLDVDAATARRGRARAPPAARPGRAASACSPSSSAWSRADARARAGSALMDDLGARRGRAAGAGRRCAASSRTTTTTSTSTTTRSRCSRRRRARSATRAAPCSAPSTPTPSRALLAEPLADELTRGTALRFGALLHDAAKPATPPADRRRAGRRSSATTASGAQTGARRARAACARASALRAHVAALTAPPPAARLPRPRAPARRAARSTLPDGDCEPVEVDVTLLSRRRPARHARAQGRRGDRRAPRARARDARRGARVARRRRRRRRWCAATSWPPSSASSPARGSASCSPRSPRRASPARSRRATRRSRSPGRWLSSPRARTG